MNEDEAYTMLCKAAGDDMEDFFILEGFPPGEPRERVSVEAVLAAAQCLMRCCEEDGMPFPPRDAPLTEQLLDIAEVAKGQALEAWWWTVAEQVLHKPEKRARVIAFIEGKLGQALGLECPEEA